MSACKCCIRRPFLYCYSTPIVKISPFYWVFYVERALDLLILKKESSLKKLSYQGESIFAQSPTDLTKFEIPLLFYFLFRITLKLYYAFMQSAQKVATASLTSVRKLFHPTALSLLLPFSSQLDVESLIECHSGRKSNLSSSERGWIKGPLLRTMMRRLLLNMQIQSG